MTSPLWLHQLSDVAAMILPILGAVWLGVQIYYKITAGRNGR